MSSSKSPLPTLTQSSTDAPPPSYSESLNAENPFTSHVSTVVDLHISPHLAVNHATNTIILIPSNISTLIASPASPLEKNLSSCAFPGETLVGFPSSHNPTVIRLLGPDNRLEFWQRAAVLRELSCQLCERLRAQGFNIASNLRETRLSQTPARISGSRDVDWKTVEPRALTDGEARVNVEKKEVCLRIENDMGLYETRTGRAIVVKELRVRIVPKTYQDFPQDSWQDGRYLKLDECV
ncbi:MAG: hypothetical protein LQ341_003819 [Variospora aurantia]|nr:MAG: hypothetical protein LQ341_003819 [Variospora aurantia]